MRFYLIFDNDPSSSKVITNSFNSIGEFECSAIVKNSHFKLHEILKFEPELIIINLDTFWGNHQEIIQKLNKSLGIAPNYIGITRCAIKGLKAFKSGFIDVIDEPTNKEAILKVLVDYKTIRVPNKFYCISYYYDFQYLLINDIVLLKADGYTTEFIMSDGRCLTNFKTLKHSHLLLPYNFQRIHKSYVINSFHVSRIHLGKGKIYLRNWKNPLPLSKSYLVNIETVKKLLLNARNASI